MAKKEFLIIGRGLAGATLSLQLQSQNISHDIIDNPKLSRSSRVAAGLINPVVLKRLKLVKGGDEFIPSAFRFYENLQKNHSPHFFFRIPIAHIFTSIGEVNAWDEKRSNPSFAQFLGEISYEDLPNTPSSYGLGLMKNTGWLDTQGFLNYHQNKLKEGQLITKSITKEDLATLQEKYQKVVICNGHLMQRLYPQLSEAFSPTRGEVLIIRSTELPAHLILHGPIFILPLGNQLFKIGATYHWNTLEDNTTEEGKKQLISKLEKIFNGSYTIVEHLAGVRPNTKDRKPLLGYLKGNIYCFNGLGSRGALMAPLLSELLLKNLFEDQILPDEYNVNRFQ